ncbi:hypothetical protein Tco_0196646 [Tanacetum coccineum]
MDKRNKHFARLRAEEQRRKPPTKAQKRNQMCTYLKNMAGFTHSQLKNKSFDELEQERIKKQKIDNDQEEVEMKKHMKIVVDEKEIAVDAIPLATKTPIIVDWKIIKEGKIEIINPQKLVKAKHGNTRPEEAYERVLWGYLKVMFEPDVESDVWRNLQGYKVTVSTAGIKLMLLVTTAERLQLLEEFLLSEG